MKKILTSTLVLMVASSTLSLAQDLTSDISKTSQMAKNYAHVAGSALFCKLDSNAIEEYIVLAQIKINKAAKDREDKILSKMDFTNSMIVASTRAPKEGCEKYRETFRMQNLAISK